MNITQRTLNNLRKLWRKEKGKNPKKALRDSRPNYNRQLQRGRNSSKVDRGETR